MKVNERTLIFLTVFFITVATYFLTSNFLGSTFLGVGIGSAMFFFMMYFKVLIATILANKK